jgi:hypothetical protein
VVVVSWVHTPLLQAQVSARSLVAEFVEAPPKSTMRFPRVAMAVPKRADGPVVATWVQPVPPQAHVSPYDVVTVVSLVPPKTTSCPPREAPSESALAVGPVVGPAVHEDPFQIHVSARPVPAWANPPKRTAFPVPVSDAQYVSTLVRAAAQLPHALQVKV